MDAILRVFVDDIVGQIVFRNVNYCIIEEIFPCVACGDSFQCLFNYCTLFLCSFDIDRHAESCFDLGDFRLQAILQHKSLLKENSLVEMINLKR